MTYRHVSAEDSGSVAITLTSSMLAMEAFSQAHHNKEVAEGIAHNAASLRKCMVLLFGEQKTKECIEYLKPEVSDQLWRVQ